MRVPHVSPLKGPSGSFEFKEKKMEGEEMLRSVARDRLTPRNDHPPTLQSFALRGRQGHTHTHALVRKGLRARAEGENTHTHTRFRSVLPKGVHRILAALSALQTICRAASSILLKL